MSVFISSDLIATTTLLHGIQEISLGLVESFKVKETYCTDYKFNRRTHFKVQVLSLTFTKTCMSVSVSVYITSMYLFGLLERKDYAQSRLLKICLISKH